MIGACENQDPTKMPVKKKPMKPEVIRKLFSKLVIDIFNDCPAGILNSVIEKESFRSEFVKVNENNFNGFKAILYVDGQTFEYIHSSKKKAYNSVCRIALQYLFGDVIEEIEMASKNTGASVKAPVDDGRQKVVTTSALPSHVMPTVRIASSIDAPCDDRPQKHDVVRLTQNNTTTAAVSSAFRSSSEADYLISLETELYSPSLMTSTLEVRCKSSKVNSNNELTNGFGETKRPELENQRHPTIGSESSVSVSHRPPLRKELKENVVKRLVVQALQQKDSGNPNAVTALFSLFEKETFRFEIQFYENGGPCFRVELFIGDKVYHAVGSSLKKGKKKAARIALCDIFPEYANDVANIAEPLENGFTGEPKNQAMRISSNDDPFPENDSVAIRLDINEVPKFSFSEYCPISNFADFAANLVQQKYDEVINSEPELKRYSVLSGIVMVENDDLTTATVICVSTGTFVAFYSPPSFPQHGCGFGYGVVLWVQ